MTLAAPALALWAALAGPAAAADRGPAPSFDAVLISIDDLRADRVRADLMPNLWALRREAVTFANAYSQATWTLPSHATMLYSQYPLSHGAGGMGGSDPRRLPGGSRGLPQVLAERGYTSGSYTNTPFLDHWSGMQDGFQRRVMHYPGPDPLPEAFDWLLSTGSGPRFLFAHTYAVHDYPAAPWPAGLDDCPIRLLPEVAPRDCAQKAQQYDHAAHCLDRELGALLARVKAAGRWDRTLVAVVADHGEALCDGPDKKRLAHNNLAYEEQLRVPWILKLPKGAGAGRAVAEPVGLIDLAPTILGALGLPAEPAFVGRDRLAAGGPAAGAGDAMYAETDRGLAARLGDWKLLRSRDGGLELYDVAADPKELENLAASRPDMVRSLDSLLREHVGGERAGWRLAVRGRAGARFVLTVASDEALTMRIPAFVEPGDELVVSGDSATIEARFTAQRDGDEDWLIVEASTPTARVTLRALRDGVALAPEEARLGAGSAPGPQPWTLSDLTKAAETAAVPAARDGLTVWRAAGSRAPEPAAPDESARRALRAAGYLP